MKFKYSMNMAILTISAIFWTKKLYGNYFATFFLYTYWGKPPYPYGDKSLYPMEEKVTGNNTSIIIQVIILL